jgi:hypothetical protein
MGLPRFQNIAFTSLLLCHFVAMGGIPSKAQPGLKFEVIGAGQSRTGTVSTQVSDS